jgi:hypothetical protein
MGKYGLQARGGGTPREVPLLKNRLKIVEENLRTGAYPSGDRLYGLLRMAFYWPGMLHDCREAAAASLPRQLE